jgi:hypothetical protein
VKEISFGRIRLTEALMGMFHGQRKNICSDYWTAVEKDRTIHKLAEAYYSFIGHRYPAI